jgi:DNA-3-methyladenine glycosylase
LKPDNYLANIYKLPALQAAPKLLGCILERRTGHGLIQLRIVEVEAYHQDEPASHAYRGLTERTAPMFEPGGRLYVYFTYGMHYCVNIVTGAKGTGEAVLLRAAEPLIGIDIMREFRAQDSITNLANGPGKLAQALGVNSTDLSGELISPTTINLVAPTGPLSKDVIEAAPRIGISKAQDLPWRFYLKDSNFISKL